MYSIPKGTHDHDNNNLKLDPGIPAHRKRSGSGCRHFCIMILATIGVITALFIGRFIVSTFYGIREPHAALLYKSNSDGLVDPASAIRPLIDEKQTFDIVATVWLRTNDSSSGSHERLDEAINRNVSTLPTERAIFNGTVFKGLRLKGKEMRTTVEYKVPTEIFKNHDLNHYDLRASFVLIPTSPSLLDNLTSYSSWRNEKVIFPPFRSWPDTGPAPTLQDKAIDSFGASIGLLSFSGIPSRCVNTTIGTPNNASASGHSLSEGDAGDEDSDDEIDGDTANENHSKPSKSGSSRSLIYPESSKGKPVLESHPYIISRSFILAGDKTQPYDRKAYNQAHGKLKTSACGLDLSPPNYDWKLCDQKFEKHGNMDTRLQLKMAEEGNGNKNRKHWAYAPYLTLAKYTWTPKDLVAVPVNREDCTKGGRFNDSEPLLPNEEYIDITWEIVYSGRSSVQLKISEAIQVVPNYNMTDTEENQQETQATSETIQGLRGHRLSEGRHPRQIMFVYALIGMIQFVMTLLDLHYWYTRSSTVGISKFATTLAAAITLGHNLLIAFFQDHSSFSMLATTIAFLPFQMTPFLMLKAIWRIELMWGQDKVRGKWTKEPKEPKRWRWMCLPSLNFVKATHRERASDRLDRSVSWTVKLALFISCCFVYFFLSPTTSFLIPPVGLSITQADKFRLLNTFSRSIASPGFIVGSVLQLWFNHQSRTFAGEYKSSAIFKGARTALGILNISTRVVGNRDFREGFSVDDLLASIAVVVWCWQAVRLPKVSQEDIDVAD